MKSTSQHYHPTGRSAFLTSLVVLLVFFAYCYFSLHHSQAAGVKTKPSPVSNLRPTHAPNGITHVLAASYYSLKEGLDAKVMLSNQGPGEMPVNISLFSLAGERLDLESITLAGNEVRAINLRERVPTNSAFEEGSVQVTYSGMTLELGGVVLMVDGERSLMFDEEFSEPAKDFRSSRLEGVWWLPSNEAATRLALSNASDFPLAVNLSVSGPGKSQEQRLKTLSFNPHETRVIKAEELLKGRFGGISIEHSGVPGALLVRGLIQEPSVGFSSVVEFRDPARAKSARLDGTGLRLGEVLGEKLRPVVVARNVSSDPTLLSGRLVYSTQNGAGSVISLPDVELQPGETREVNLRKALNERTGKSEMIFAGLEFEHTGALGSLVMSGLSISSSGNQVFRVPLIDAETPSSSTGTYPWSIAGSSSTVVYVKNATDKPQQYTMQISYEGGSYRMDSHKLEAGQSIVVDLRKLRDEQVVNQFGERIPADASGGQLHWTAVGPTKHVLIGRVEQVDLARGMSMTASCGLCCQDSFDSGFLTPGSVTGFVGDGGSFTAMEFMKTCYGNFTGPFPHGTSDWWSSDETVATCDSTGFATGVDEGSAQIQASWDGCYWDYDIWLEDCECTPANPYGSATCNVARTPHHLQMGNDMFASTSCSGVRRVIDYVVVDNHTPARPVGSVDLIEDPATGITDSCNNNNVIRTSSCSSVVDSAGVFEDDLFASCPGSDSCGFDIPASKWQWCKGAAHVTLATLNYSVHHDEVKVNGRAIAWDRGTNFLP